MDLKSLEKTIEKEARAENILRLIISYKNQILLAILGLLIISALIVFLQHRKLQKIELSSLKYLEAYNKIELLPYSLSNKKDEAQLKQIAETKANLVDLTQNGKGVFISLSFLELANLAIKEENYEEAIKYLETLRKTAEVSAIKDLAGLKLASLYLKSEKQAEAKKILINLAKKSEFFATSNELLASIYLKEGNKEGAVKLIEEIIASDYTPSATKIRAKKILYSL